MEGLGRDPIYPHLKGTRRVRVHIPWESLQCVVHRNLIKIVFSQGPQVLGTSGLGFWVLGLGFWV